MDIMEKIYEIADWVKTRPDFDSLELDNDPKNMRYDIICIDTCGNELKRWGFYNLRLDSGYQKILKDFVQNANMMRHVIIDTAKKPMYASKEYQGTVIEPTLGIHIILPNESIVDEEDYLLEYPEN